MNNPMNVANNHSNNRFDSGLDLIIPDNYEIDDEDITKISHGIACEPTEIKGYWLVPRSGIRNSFKNG